MKFKVLKPFRDKETSKKHEAGSEYTNTKRGKELMKLGYLEQVEEKKPRRSTKKGEVNES